MSPVEQVSNWGYCDTLDGRRLVQGERLRVRWPDGSETVETCHIHAGRFAHEDHGRPAQGPNDIAFVTGSMRGLDVVICLRQEGILCERVNE